MSSNQALRWLGFFLEAFKSLAGVFGSKKKPELGPPPRPDRAMEIEQEAEERLNSRGGNA